MRLVFAGLLAGLLGAAPSAAQDAVAVAVEAETFVGAVPESRDQPLYPLVAAKYSREGWVVVSYVVSPAGDVVEPMIEDSSGSAAFEESALKAVSRWRYKPATLDGKPVEQSMVKTQLRFQIEGGGAQGATRGFRDKYREASELLAAGNFTALEPLIFDLEFGGRDNLYEDALFWALKFGYLDATQSTDTEQRMRALRLAMGSSDEYLPPDVYVGIAQRLYVMQVQAREFGSALWTFARLKVSRAAKESALYERVIAELTPSSDQIQRLINGQELLVVSAKIGEHDYWVHDLLRRSFSLANVNGRIDVVDVRCARGTKRYDSFPDDAVWQVPESWGECGVYIKGEPGTTFVFEEYPTGTPATQLTRE